MTEDLLLHITSDDQKDFLVRMIDDFNTMYGTNLTYVVQLGITDRRFISISGFRVQIEIYLFGKTVAFHSRSLGDELPPKPLTLHDLPVGAKFQTPGRKRLLTKLGNLGRLSHPLLKGSYIQHDDKGEIIFVRHCEVMNSSGRKWDMKADTEVIHIRA